VVNTLKKYIASNDLFGQKDKLLIATSGGVDSIVLCNLLLLLNHDISIAHCNFQLRGEDSNGDEAFVEQLAEELGIPVFTKRFNTKNYAKEHKISTQLAARHLRYEWFNELAIKDQFNYILTAHHASDQTETVLYNLTKGTGLSGLRGIPNKNKNIRRPLLFATKEKILDYAQTNKLKWREDSSNSEDKYSRNLIRNQIIPELKKINPSIDETMNRNIEKFKNVETFLDAESVKIKSTHLTRVNKASTLALDWLTENNKALLHHLLSHYGFNYFQIETIYTGRSESGKTFTSSSHQLSIDRQQLIISSLDNIPFTEINVSSIISGIKIPFYQFTFTEQKSTETTISKDSNIAYLDADKLTLPFSIRPWRQGDKFMPLGMNSEKKLSDFMIDEKIPVNLKKRLPIFEYDNQIFWIAGYRIDNRFKVTEKTKTVLIIKLESQDV
jgi:tRNA(Ile)-lysidine synthase